MISWTAQDFLDVLYRTILGRQPDQAGFQNHLRSLLDDSVSPEDLIRKFVNSEEALSRRSDVLASLLAVADRPSEAMMVMSCGVDCYVSSFMKRWSLKRFSGPFDWIFSTPQMAAHCLTDDFRVFLDRSQYEAIAIHDRIHGPDVNLCDHRYYRDTYGVRFMFNHYDPSSADGYDYLVRCTRRFQTALASPGRKLFVIVSRAEASDLDLLRQLNDVLQQRTRNAVLKIFLYQQSDVAITRIAETKLADTASVYFMETLSSHDGVRFADFFDELAIARVLLGPSGRLQSVGLNA